MWDEGHNYDSDFDFNRNGKLDPQEYVVMDDFIFGDDDEHSHKSRKKVVPSNQASKAEPSTASKVLGVIIILALAVICGFFGAR